MMKALPKICSRRTLQREPMKAEQSNHVVRRMSCDYNHIMDFGKLCSDTFKPFAGFLLVYLPYSFGFFMRDTSKPIWRSYLNTMGIVAFVAFVMWGAYGTHVENADPIYGGGDIVQDFQPTDQQRNEYGLSTLLTFEIAALLGVARRDDGPTFQEVLRRKEGSPSA